MAVHLCEVDEEHILSMSYPFYMNVMKELAVKMNYQWMSVLPANSYCSDGIKYAQEANPFNVSLSEEKKTKPRLTINSLKGTGILKG